MRRSDALSAVAELAATQHGVCTRAQATTRGLSSRHVASLKAEHLVAEPVTGVLVFSATPPTWHQRMMVASLVAGGGFHAAFRAAAFLHGLDGFRCPGSPEVVGGPSARSITGIEVIQHWVTPLPADDLTVVEGISTTGLARTVVDVCGLGDGDLAVRAVDDFERRGASLQWLRLTAERLHRPGQSGTRTALELLDRRQNAGRVTDSWFERLVERCVAMPWLPPWERQHEVKAADGQLIGRIDLACPTLLLGVEAHSREFHFGRRAESLDQRRDNRFRAEGWDLLYLGWYDTERPEDVAKIVESVARRRAGLMGIDLPWAS